MNTCEDQDMEVEILRSIYCKDGEMRDSQEQDGRRIEVQLDFTHQLKEKHTGSIACGSVVFLLPHNYPQESLPYVSVTCPKLQREALDTINSIVAERARDLKGQMVLLDLVCLAKELLEKELPDFWQQQCNEHQTSSIGLFDTGSSDEFVTANNLILGSDSVPVSDPKAQNVNSLSSINKESQQKSSGQASGAGKADSVTALLHLDHMRSKSSYIKLIRKWVAELGLVGRLVFHQRTILILLQGDARSVKEYIVRNRTAIVDVDSRGRGCKERMLSVLCEVPAASAGHCERGSPGELVVVEPASLEELVSLFSDLSLSGIYNEHVRPLVQGPARNQKKT